MDRIVFVVVFLVLWNVGHAQTSEVLVSDTIPRMETDSLKTGKKWDIGLDLASRYIWRGQSWGGNYPVFQPSFNYAITNKISIGVWGTTNFHTDDFEKNGTTPESYQEFDIGLSYALTDFLMVQIWDYYWPSLHRQVNVDKNYFNYGPDGVKSVDASIVFDFSDGYSLPFDATISTLISGNDYRYDGDHAERNFTTYVEAGYTFYDIFEFADKNFARNINLHPVIGGVINNEAAYYTYASYEEPSFINLALSASRTFAIGNKITVPVTLSYVHNAATANTEPFGRNFLSAALSVYY